MAGKNYFAGKEPKHLNEGLSNCDVATSLEIAKMSTNYPTRFITQSDMESETMQIIQADVYGVETKDLVVRILRSIEDVASNNSGRIKPIKIKTSSYKTVLSNDFNSGSDINFYTLGIECTDTFSKSVGAFRIRISGKTISIIRDVKKSMPIGLFFLTTTLSMMFEGGKRNGEDAKPSGLYYWIFLVIPIFFLAVFLSPGLLVGGIGILLYMLTYFAITSFNKTVEKQEEESFELCSNVLAQIYHQINVDEIAESINTKKLRQPLARRD